MKKISLLFLLLVFGVACKSTSSSPAAEPVASTKLDKTSQVAIKGNWKISSISYPGSSYFKVNSFGVADSQCFVGSTWSFISNNNKGNMSLTKSDCPSFNSPIVWSINKDGKFILKIVDATVKSKDVKDGYILTVANQTETSFQLLDKIDVGGQKKDITYQFEKTN
ncbi:MAG TPA: lipocalin family protein [Flavobacterium sp.]|nr:lipocalin family protein [Flavobacterium sp.]